MKKLLLSLLALVALTAKAQNFEGTIKWSMNLEITDPATKAKMEDAKKKMADPAEQAKMKQMQEKMNDPQFKAMMDANPQMKAQMENAMKMMQGGDGSSMTNSSMSIKIKGGNALTKMEGMMSMETLYLKDKDESYLLFRDSKTYNVMPKSNGTQAGSNEPAAKVTKTSETTKILGYTCTKYLVEISERGKTINESVWTTTDIKNIDFKQFSQHRVGRGQSLFYAGMEGVPLRVVATTPQGNMTMEVTEIKSESLPASDFTIPTDFKQTQGMFGR